MTLRAEDGWRYMYAMIDAEYFVDGRRTTLVAGGYGRVLGWGLWSRLVRWRTLVGAAPPSTTRNSCRLRSSRRPWCSVMPILIRRGGHQAAKIEAASGAIWFSSELDAESVQSSNCTKEVDNDAGRS